MYLPAKLINRKNGSYRKIAIRCLAIDSLFSHEYFLRILRIIMKTGSFIIYSFYQWWSDFIPKVVCLWQPVIYWFLHCTCKEPQYTFKVFSDKWDQA